MISPIGPVAPRVRTRRSPLGLDNVSITGGVLQHVQQLNASSIIPHCDQSLESVGWVGNFVATAEGRLATDRVGRLFTDSEIYKALEAMIWEDARTQSSTWSDRIAELTGVLERAQSDDGYLNTYYGYEGGPGRYTDLEWGHELYCHGHLLQAAVAAIRTGANPALADVALRAARHICAEFAEGQRESLCGHPEVETALVELYRATGERDFLEQARLFVERRGHRILADTMYRGRDYYQDNVPVRDAEVLVGHAVRALYLTAGAIDVAVETHDDELLDAARRQYDRTLARRTYLTGGMGSNHHGETYGDDFELPSERAYAETCAGVASLQVAWRLLLATGDEHYADVMERTLFNTILSAPSLDGTEFFYVNTLHRRVPGQPPEEGVPSLRRTDGMRARWYTTSCCPTNIARLFASLGSYLSSTTSDELAVHLFAPGRIRAQLDAGEIEIEIATEYPLNGDVTITVIEAPEQPCSLAIRVPAWASEATIEVTGDDTMTVGPGRTSVLRTWAAGDRLALRMPLAPRWTRPDARIDHIRGCVAVERGPVVYALESIDNPDVDLESVTVDASSPLIETGLPEHLGEGVAVKVRGTRHVSEESPWPFSSGERPSEADSVALTLIPYALWANRGSSTMRIWMPESQR